MKPKQRKAEQKKRMKKLKEMLKYFEDIKEACEIMIRGTKRELGYKK